MGELIHIREFTSLDPTGSSRSDKHPRRYWRWYFPQEIKRTDHAYQHNDWVAMVESTYPDKVAIHIDDMEPQSDLRMRIRRYTRDSITGDVIWHLVEMHYKYLHRWVADDGRKRAYRNEVKHGYYVFHFESSEDVVKFALCFSDVISEISPRHPTKHADVTEEEIEDARRNPFGVYEEW